MNDIDSGVALNSLLRPESVAVVGASGRKGAIGHSVIDNLQKLSATVRIYPVNPKYKEVNGLACYPSFEDLPEAVDCAFIGVRADHGPGVLREAGAVGVRAAVINATGYASGGENGRRLLDDLQHAAAAYDMAVCGPNNIGYFNVTRNVGLWTLPNAEFRRGSIGLIAHSGTASMVLGGDPNPLGLAYVITCGDEAVLSAADYLRYVVNDEAVRLVMLFIETIRQPEEFEAAAQQAADLGKQIIVLKVGRSAVGSRAVAAHTGGIAGEPEIYEALFRKLGIIQVQDMDEMIQTARLMAALPDGPRRPGVVPITMSGGIGALVADTAGDIGLELPPLSPATADAIRTANPALFTPQNPLDAWGLGWDPVLFPGVLSPLLAQDDVGTVALCLDVPASGRAETSTARSAAPLLAKTSGDTDVRFVLLNTNAQGTPDPETVAMLEAASIPVLMGVTESLRALEHWTHAPRARVHAPERTSSVPRLPTAQPGFLHEAGLLTKAGITILTGIEVSDANEAVRAAEATGFPVVLKGLHPAVVHKSEADLVHLGAATPADVERSFSRIMAALERLGRDRSGAAVVVQQTIESDLELIIGVRNVARFGTFVVLGLGGIYVETLRKSAVRMAPLTADDIHGMLAELSLDEVLGSARGRPARDIAALISSIQALSNLAMANRDTVTTIEVNPVVVRRQGEGIVGLDLLVEYSAAAGPEGGPSGGVGRP